jgi:hypothetical protein
MLIGDGDRGQELEIVRDTSCGHRFLVKLAIGFGALFLNECFRTSPDADVLRSCLWNKDPSRGPMLFGSPFLATSTTSSTRSLTGAGAT